jgi:hypothetical protein
MDSLAVSGAGSFNISRVNFTMTDTAASTNYPNARVLS